MADRISFFSSDSSTETSLPPPPPPSKPYEVEEEPDAAPEPKRRKTSPTTLDKIEELSTSNGNFSFTFDTKSTPSTPQVTPKFGSFNFVVSESEKDRFLPSSKEEGAASVRGEKKRESGNSEERNGVVVGELGNN